jgi:hypothetical protein
MIKVCITRKVFDAAAPECFGDVGAILETELHRNVHDAVVQICETPGGPRFHGRNRSASPHGCRSEYRPSARDIGVR